MAELTARAGRNRRPPPRARSHAVRLLRVVLPLAAIGLLGVVAFWPQIGTDVPPPPPVVARPEGPEMTDPRFFGTDRQDRPFTITANRASQSGADAGSPVDLDAPDAQIKLGDGSTVRVTARTGRFDQPNQRLRLDGDVEVVQDRGYDMRGQELQVELESGDLRSDRPVAGKGPNGEVAGQGLQITDQGRKIVFTGRSRLLLHPDRGMTGGTSQ
jgi:lipopolysaccharide export system protein LptC